jgi:hypothetical protein
MWSVIKRTWHFVKDPHHSNAVVAVFTVGIFFTGLIYAFFAYLQWQTMKRSLHVDQRAWIKFDFSKEEVSGTNVESKRQLMITPGQPLVIPSRFTNIGKTTALDVRAAIVIEVLPNGNDPHLPDKDMTISLHLHPSPGGPSGRGAPAEIATFTLQTSVIYPNDVSDFGASRKHFSTTREVEDDPVTPGEVLNLNRGSSYIAMWGQVWYSDVFGVDHWTKFCKVIGRGDTQNEKCSKYSYIDDKIE